MKSRYEGTPCVVIAANMDRIVLPASMLAAMRRTRDFARSTGSISSTHPLNMVVENAGELPGAISLAPVPHEAPAPLFAAVGVKGGKIGECTSCPICLVDYEDGDDCVISKCAHAFHRECIRCWVVPNTRVKGANRTTCPLCRSQL